jgi:putative colanic acid biosynthesis UDP-glucose lipid carrier transferase
MNDEENLQLAGLTIALEETATRSRVLYDRNDASQLSHTPISISVGPQNPAQSRVKRAMDILIAACALLFVLPLMIVAAAAVRLDSPGPVFFRQRRGGYGGETFEILKFRTMYVLEDSGPIRHATRNDSRITRVGGFLRRRSIDELPQLINVLRGDMSIVGPRPHALSHDEFYGQEIPHYCERTRVRPGITGLAQMSGHRGEVSDVAAMASRVTLDLEYIETWSVLLDVKILFRTLMFCFSDDRAY